MDILKGYKKGKRALERDKLFLTSLGHVSEPRLTQVNLIK
jgi:hypothetical protein